MFVSACGGGGSNPAPAVVPLALQITPFEGNPIGTDPINSDGVGLLNENADGSITTVDIGTLTDNKNANGQAYYALPETAPTGTNNDEFDIMGETGEQVLQFRGKYAGDYEASTRPKYTLKIERYDNKQHYDSVKAGEAGAKPPQILDYILNLKNLEQGLAITAADDAPFVHKDGEGFLNEEVDGSGEGNAILLLTLGDGTGTYRLTNHTDRFEITGNQLFYKGTALDYENPIDPKSFTLNIAHTNAGVTQTFEYTINSQDQIEVLGITPPGDDAPIFSDGAGLLDENADGSTNRIEIGTIIDNIVTTLPISYRLADASASNDNGDFQIADGKLYYIGADAGDFEAGDKFMVDIIRTLDGNAETEQTLQRVINLKNLNDNPPDLTGYLPLAEGQTEPTEITDYIVVGNVGVGKVTVGTEEFDVAYAMVFAVDAGDYALTIDFVFSPGKLPITIVETETDGKLTGFQITTGIANHVSIAKFLNGDASSAGFADRSTQQARDGLAAWQDIVKSVTYIGDTGAATVSPSNGGPIFTDEPTLTGTSKGIVVAAGTTGVIADFNDNDPDGDLNSFTYSVTDSDGGTDGDSTYFMIDEDTGELRFADGTDGTTVPSFNWGENATNEYDIIITITDDEGKFTDTQSFRVVITPGAGDTNPNSVVPNAGESVAESVPSAKDSASKTLQEFLKEMEAEHQSAPKEDPHQWRPDSYNGDSDMIDLPDTGPDIL